MSDNVGKQQIRAFAERIIRLEDEKDQLTADLREIRAEARGNGFNVKALNSAIKLARMSATEREEAENFQLEMQLYVDAIDGVEQ